MMTDHFSSHDLLNPGDATRLIGSQAARSETALVDSLCQLNSIFQSLIHTLSCSLMVKHISVLNSKLEAAAGLLHRKDLLLTL